LRFYYNGTRVSTKRNKAKSAFRTSGSRREISLFAGCRNELGATHSVCGVGPATEHSEGRQEITTTTSLREHEIRCLVTSYPLPHPQTRPRLPRRHHHTSRYSHPLQTFLPPLFLLLSPPRLPRLDLLLLQVQALEVV